MRGLILSILALGLLVAGCGENRTPPIENLRSQLLRETCDALREGDLQRAETALVRLREAAGDDSFSDYTREWLEQRTAMQAVNAALKEGNVKSAQDTLKEATGGAYRMTATARPAVEALAAFESYLAKKPFTRAQQAEQALQELNQYSESLRKSSSFRAFIAKEKAQAQEMKEAEEMAAVRSLIEQLDLAAVTGKTAVQPLLGHLAAIRPQTDLLQTLDAAWNGDAGTLTEHADKARTSAEARRALEVAVCIAWQDMSPAAWRAVVPLLTSDRPASLSGMLMKAVADADVGNWEAAVEELKTLSAAATPSQQHVAKLMTTYLLPPHQFRAWCWQIPCPGIPELLSRIAQIRAYGRIEAEGL